MTSASVHPGTVVAQSTVIVNPDPPGVLRIALAQTMPSGAGLGSLVTVDFGIASNAPAGTYPIDLARVSLNEDQLAVGPDVRVPGPDPTDGQITVVGGQIIQGFKFDDVENDGVRGTSEAGLAGWTIFLDADPTAYSTAASPAR